MNHANLLDAAKRIEVLLALGVTGDGGVLGKIGLRSEGGEQVQTLGLSASKLVGAIEWLVSKGLAKIERDGGCEWVRLVSSKVCEVVASSNGAVVWVNAPDGSCIGRFNKRGGIIDVHRTLQEQISGMGECLDCSHDGDARDQWQKFRESMRRHYGLEVKEDMVVF